MTTPRLGQALNRSIGQASGLTVAVLLCVLATACSQQDNGTLPAQPLEAPKSAPSEDTNPQPSTSVPASTSSAISGPADESIDIDIPEQSEGVAFEEYIAARLEAFYEARDKAFAAPTATPEIDYPELAEYSVNPQLAVMHDTIRAKFERGVANREPEQPVVGTSADEEHRISGLVTSEDGVVTVFECEVNDDALYYVATGELENDNVVTILGVATLERFETGWKLVTTSTSQRLEGVAGCYLASESEFPY